MKRYISALFAVALAASGFAATVDRTVAADYGATFLDRVDGRQHSIRKVEMETSEYYVVNYYPQGWAIIAADDAAKPLIGYSATGSLQWHSLPENMRVILGDFSRQVKDVKRSGRMAHAEWSTVAAPKTRSIGDVVKPLIPVNWNQPSPYNRFCPSGTLVGCVAVAMSQAMAVQRYPSQPKGSVSYNCAGIGQLDINFDEELAYNWNNILSGANNYREAARLLYHAGMSVMMGYGKEGSGIPSNEVYRISRALVNNFSYPSTVNYHYRDRYSMDKWNQLVLNELLAGRAVVYNAIDTKGNYGHSFNVDGYDENGNFHLNWGWGGVGNGYFALNALSDAAMNMNYDAGHVCVTGIGSPDSPFHSLELSDTRIEENTPGGSVVGVVTLNGEIPPADCTVSVRGRYSSTLDEYEEVPFEMDGAMLRTTRTITAADRGLEIMINVKDNEGHSMTQGYTLSVEAPRSLEASTSMAYDRQTESFTFKTKHNVTYTLAGPDGTVISQGSISPIPVLTLSRQTLAKGANTLTLVCGGDTKRIVIRN